MAFHAWPSLKKVGHPPEHLDLIPGGSEAPPSSSTLSVANPTFSSIDFAIFICPTHNENCISPRDLLVLNSHITLSCQYRNFFSPRKLLKTERKSEHPSWPAPQEKIFC